MLQFGKGAHAKQSQLEFASAKVKLPGKDEPQGTEPQGSQRLSPNSTPSVCLLSISHLVLPLCPSHTLAAEPLCVAGNMEAAGANIAIPVNTENS